MSDACIFCRIVKGSISSHKVYEDDLVLAILDIHPSALGHTLVVPKVHVARVEDLTEKDSLALFRVLRKLVGDVQRAVESQASTIGINNGPESGQEIPHVHIHIIPRFRNDHGGVIQSVSGKGYRYRDMEMHEIAEKIRNLAGLNR